jgi:hypothetical protein
MVLDDPREGDVEPVLAAYAVGEGAQHSVRVEEAESLLTLPVQAEEQEVQTLQDLLLALAVSAHGVPFS